MENNKKNLIVITLLILIVFAIVTLFLTKNKDNDSTTVYENIIDNENNSNNNIYDMIVNSLEENTDVIIYYYDSSVTNKYNKEIENYLNEQNIKYYAYDNAIVGKEEYDRVLSKLNIDSDLFGMPAIIYMHYGMMYANIINIDSLDTVKQFIDEYNLYTIK